MQSQLKPEESIQPERKKIIIKKKTLKTATAGAAAAAAAEIFSLSFRLIDFSICDQNTETQATGEEQQHVPHNYQGHQNSNDPNST